MFYTIKAEVLIRVRVSKKIVLAIEICRAYSDELELLRAQHFVADCYYDNVKLIQYFE